MSDGMIFDIQRFSVSDGPGIRTTVFFKGCPLRCVWCHNPESLSPKRQLRHVAQFCQDCGCCAAACPSHIAKGAMACDVCGTCAEVCPSGALCVCGRIITADALREELLRDRAFFDHSGGGVTLSGGEPTQQPEFVRDILSMLQTHRIQTALDTCGACATETFLSLCALANIILFDVKMIDNVKHQRYTGVSNTLILHNLEKLASQQDDIRVRVPLIPGVNDSTGDLSALADFLLNIGIQSVDVIPYHTYGDTKYAQLRMPVPPRFCVLSDAEVQDKLGLLHGFGLKAKIV